MAEESKGRTGAERELPHRLVLEGQVLTVTGVREVLRFEETAVLLRAGERLLQVRGEGLTLRQLAPQEGRVEIRGRVDGLGYETAGTGGSLRRRLFG